MRPRTTPAHPCHHSSRQPILSVCLFALTVLLSTASLAASLEAQVTDSSGTPLEYAVISLHGKESRKARPGTRAIVDQRDRQFAPTVLPIQTGTEVSFPNTDDVRHHVYSFSAPNQFELKLYHGEPSQPVLFDEPGIVVLGCNIHDGMIGYLPVIDSPWFARTDERGRLRMDDVPPGEYTLQLWHPDMNMSVDRQVITISENTRRIDLAIDTRPVRPAAAANPLQALFDD